MNATIRVLLCAPLLVTGLAAQRAVQETSPSKVGSRVAAIQGLNAVVQENEQRLAEKDAEIDELRAEMVALKAQMSGLAQRLEEPTANR